MTDENILTWSVTNWITVVLMAAIAFAVVGVIQRYYAGKKAGA